MAPRRHDDPAAADAARDIERVLGAEREAEAQLATAGRQAQALLEAARDEARAMINRALERGARRQAAHAAALERRLATRRERALAAAQALAPIGDAQLAAAIAQAAARLTGADGPLDGGMADDAG